MAECLGPGQENALLYKVADFFVMPSVYEPCGLAQMECQRYGCIPIVRKTGGLADTVTDTVNGFVFEEYNDAALLGAFRRAVAAFRDSSAMSALIRAALRQQNGWDSRIDKYEAVYRHQ